MPQCWYIITNTFKTIKSEQEIIARCLVGDSRAEYELFKLYGRAIYNACYRIVNHSETAKDMLQEVFVKIFKNLSSYSDQFKFYTWAQRIAVNHCINHQKKMGVDYDFKEDMGVYDSAESVDEYESQSYKVEQVKDSIMQLPSGYREILSLYLLEGYDHREISEILGISESTSKSQYSRAKKKVKQLIASNYGRSI